MEGHLTKSDTRPLVSEDIRGIPQGWQDDPSIPIQTHPYAYTAPRTHSPRPSTSYSHMQYSISSAIDIETDLDDSIEFNNLFSSKSRDTGISTPSTSSNRNRVMGITSGPIITSNPNRTFLPPNVTDILPFAEGFSSWSIKEKKTGEGWREIHGKGGKGKRVWGESIYKVGYEQDVLDLCVTGLNKGRANRREARLHEAMYDELGRNTLVDEAETVLDIGTGLGLWPIAQALEWPNSTFVGIDIAPCQIDLGLLAEAERTARSSASAGNGEKLGLWESVSERVNWERIDILEPLPFDSGVFNLVHIRFIGLGVPESKWGDLIDECVRVLKGGGKLEIVEMSYNPSGPLSLRNSFSSLLLSNLIQPIPSLPISFNLPATQGLISSPKPVFQKSWTEPLPRGTGTEGFSFSNAITTWVRSSLDYKGTAQQKSKGRGKKDGFSEKVLRSLAQLDNKWRQSQSQSQLQPQPQPPEIESESISISEEISIWIWVSTKR